MSRTGRYKWMPITGASVVGSALLAFSGCTSTPVLGRRGDHFFFGAGWA